MVSHISAGQRGAHRARIEPRRLDAVLDRGGIGLGENARYSTTFCSLASDSASIEARADAGGEQRRFPFVGLADIGGGQRGDAQRRIDGAREIFGALDVAGQPVQVFGGARQHT